MPDTLLQSPVDYDALAALREVMAEAFVPLVAEFQQQLNQGIEIIAAAANGADYAALKSCAHQLKGSAMDMACNALAQTLADIEHCASAASQVQLLQAIDKLQQQMPHTLQILGAQQ